MSLETTPDRSHLVSPATGRRRAAAWGWPMLLGVLMVAIGALAIVGSGVTGLASVLFFGGVLIAAGAIEIVESIRERRQGPYLLFLLGGIFSVIVGVLFLLRPLAGLGALTFLAGAYFLVSGLFRGITSLMDRYASWGWDLFYGVVAILLGITVFRAWPISSLWVLGTLVGVEIILRGASIIGAALAVRRSLLGPAGRTALPRP
jgi:uncharacterized membrane protein HdeD (DUF308 family)